jgi:hypothetical protein
MKVFNKKSWVRSAYLPRGIIFFKQTTFQRINFRFQDPDGFNIGSFFTVQFVLVEEKSQLIKIYLLSGLL